MGMTVVDLEELKASALDSTPVDYDWSGGFTTDWDARIAYECQECQEVYIGSIGYSECPECGTENFEDGPMMSYYYPLPDEPDEDAIMRLVDLPLCVVYVDGNPGLALTGGGMDLSWEICEAFMMLGYLPPIHFVDLPGMANRGASKRDREIIDACRKSVETAKNRLDWKLRGLLQIVQRAEAAEERA